jgi:cytochrome b pre-mRNA-processing protein 3
LREIENWTSDQATHVLLKLIEARPIFQANRFNRGSLIVNVLRCLRAAALFSFSGRNPTREAADIAYGRVVEQARQPVFFTHYGVPDTFDGRFELICLHAFLYLHRLKAEQPQASRLCQSFFDRMFADFDRALREMGVGDLSVGKHVKHMTRAFYGRVLSYEAGPANDDSALAAALARNLFGTLRAPDPAADHMVAYVRGAVRKLRSQPAADLLVGQAGFEVPSEAPAKGAYSPAIEAQ